MPVETLQRLIALFEDGVPDVGDPPSEADLKPWRDRIDALDRTIVRLLNERSICANAIGHVKKQISVPVYAPEREAAVLQNVIDHNDGPLPDAAVRGIFERIIDETRALERRLFQEAQRAQAARERALSESNQSSPPSPS